MPRAVPCAPAPGARTVGVDTARHASSCGRSIVAVATPSALHGAISSALPEVTLPVRGAPRASLAPVRLALQPLLTSKHADATSGVTDDGALSGDAADSLLERLNGAWREGRR